MSYQRENLPDVTTYFESHGLVLKGPTSAKWKTTTCNFHGGSDSMRVNTQTGAWVCMSCGEKGGDVLAYEMKLTGVDFVDACKAVGAWVEDGKTPSSFKPTPLPARQAIQALAFESTLTAVAACNLGNGKALTEKDRHRLLRAANRISTLSEAFQ